MIDLTPSDLIDDALIENEQLQKNEYLANCDKQNIITTNAEEIEEEKKHPHENNFINTGPIV